MSAHTPGPWAVGFSDGSGCCDPERREGATITAGDHPARDDVGGIKIVVRGGRDDYGLPVGIENPADARLISQAPALLEIAREFADSCLDCGGSGTVQRYDTDDSDCAVTEFVDCPECAHVRAAIAKAEGKP